MASKYQKSGIIRISCVKHNQSFSAGKFPHLIITLTKTVQPLHRDGPVGFFGLIINEGNAFGIIFRIEFRRAFLFVIRIKQENIVVLNACEQHVVADFQKNMQQNHASLQEGVIYLISL